MKNLNTILTQLFVILLLGAFSQGTLSAQYENQGLKFSKAKKLKKVLKKAKKNDQMVFVDFTAEWCVPCQIMEESTFLDFHLGNLYNDNFINYKLDIDSKEGKKFKKKYAITFLPSFMYFDQNGEPQMKEHGSKTVEELMAMAKKFMRENS